MSGSRIGGLKSAAKNKANDKDFYVKIGKMGGSMNRPHSRPFHMNRELAREAGRKGGLVRLEQRKGGEDATVQA